MMKTDDSLKKLKDAIKNHEPIIVNYGKGYFTNEDIKEITFWSKDKNRYVSETGQWSTELLLDIIKGKVENLSIELMPNE